MARKPRIHLIATGGTIAGVAADPTDTQNYIAGVLTAEQLIASVPSLKDLAEISVEQLYNLDSKDMTPEHWLGLARATQVALDREDVDGVVITHGTDTLEESAYFLDLVLPPGKPVVSTGAMRPATSLSPDGPMNLYCAVLLAASPEAQGLGVVAVMNNRIHAARCLRKIHCYGLDAFSSGEAGILGRVPPVVISRRPTCQTTTYPLGSITRLPEVEILYVAAGSRPGLAVAAIEAGVQGLVLALPGNCSLPDAWSSIVELARARNISIFFTSRCAQSGVTISSPGGVPIASNSSPEQARVALMVQIAAKAPH